MRRMQAILKRYGFTPPALYRELAEQGCFMPFGGKHLQFSDLHWLEEPAIAGFQFHKDQIKGLVPFAQTANHDLWCWYPALNDGGPAPIVFCPDEDEVAFIHAPDFTAFLYRLLLEEYACTGLTEHLDVRQSRELLDGYAESLSPHFPEAWRERLSEIVARPFTSDPNDYFGVIDEDELADIISADIDYVRLDEEFEHFLGN